MELEVGVDVFKGNPLRQHHHLRMVEELADFLCSPILPLMLGRHPGFGCFFDQFLTDRVNATVDCGDGARTGRAALGLLVEFGPEFLEGLHVSLAYVLSTLDASQCLRGEKRSRRGFVALVLAAVWQAGPIQGLGIVVAGQHAEAY